MNFILSTQVNLAHLYSKSIQENHQLITSYLKWSNLISVAKQLLS